MKVIGLQLIDGSYVIGEPYVKESCSGCTECTCEDDNVVLLNKPLSVVTYQGENGKLMLRVVPYCLHAEDYCESNVKRFLCEFQKTSIITTYEPNKQLVDHYNSLFGSGIIVPTNNIIPING